VSEAVALIGAGGHAKVVLSTLLEAGYSGVELYDDDRSLWGTEILGARVAGAPAELRGSGRRAVIGVGSNAARAQIARELGLDWLTVVHPRAWVHASVRLGPGTVVFAGAVVQPDAVLGCHVIVNTSASIDHDCRVADYAHLAPGVRLCGGVSVAEGALLGVASAAIPGTRVGAWAVVGAGAVCVGDVAERTTVRGVPARPVEPSRGSAGHP